MTPPVKPEEFLLCKSFTSAYCVALFPNVGPSVLNIIIGLNRPKFKATAAFPSYHLYFSVSLQFCNVTFQWGTYMSYRTESVRVTS